MARLIKSHDQKWMRLQALPRELRLAAYGLARSGSMSDGRLDVLRRAAYNEPFYWGLDVVFSDSEKHRLFRRDIHSNGFEKPSALLQGYYQELAQLHPNAD